MVAVGCHRPHRPREEPTVQIGGRSLRSGSGRGLCYNGGHRCGSSRAPRAWRCPTHAQVVSSLVSPGPPDGGPTHRWTPPTGASRATLRARGTPPDRCVVCHPDIGSQIEGRRGSHGGGDRSPSCGACHPEHRGRTPGPAGLRWMGIPPRSYRVSRARDPRRSVLPTVPPRCRSGIRRHPRRASPAIGAIPTRPARSSPARRRPARRATPSTAGSPLEPPRATLRPRPHHE